MSTRSNKSAPKAKPVTAGKPAAGVAATAPLGHLQGFSAALLVLIVAGGLYLASPASFMA